MIRKKIQSTYDAAGNGSSLIMSSGLAPSVYWRNILSYSKSPVVIVKVVTIERPGVPKDDLCMYQIESSCDLRNYTAGFVNPHFQAKHSIMCMELT